MTISNEFPELILNKKQIMILRILKSFYEEDDDEEVEMLTSSDIYDLLSGNTSLSYISRILNELEKLGLVESEEEADEHGKTKYYSLTEHGAEVVNALEKLASEIKHINEMILKKAKFKLVKSGNRYKIKLE